MNPRLSDADADADADAEAALRDAALKYHRSRTRSKISVTPT